MLPNDFEKKLFTLDVLELQLEVLNDDRNDFYEHIWVFTLIQIPESDF